MPDRPNVLLIIADHQAFYGHDRPGEFENKRPRFERFASEGVRFDRAYSVCPICTPARASMMTGMYPSRHGLRWNTESEYGGNLIEFRQGQSLYSHHLSRAGYRNAYVGKWHCGRIRLPIDYGIEGWSLPGYGDVYHSEEYLAYAKRLGLGEARARIEHCVGTLEREGSTAAVHEATPWRYINGSGVMEGPPEAHEEQFVAHLAAEKLRELASSQQPWSLVASFWGPHHPYFPSEPFASMIDPKTIPEYPSFRDDLSGRPLRHLLHRDVHYPGSRQWKKDWPVWQEILARCYAQALQLDAAIGQLLDALAESGQAENTLVMWVSDHGDAVASHGGLWDKASTFIEEVARVPLAARWPARFAGGRRTAALVSNMDVTATMLDAAGVSVPPEMDSRSLLPLCRGGAEEPRGQVICEHNGHDNGQRDNILQRVVVTERYKYVAALFDGDELYDLKQDPYEMHNLVDSPTHREVKQDLHSRIIAHIEGGNDLPARSLAYALKHGF